MAKYTTALLIQDIIFGVEGIEGTRTQKEQVKDQHNLLHYVLKEIRPPNSTDTDKLIIGLDRKYKKNNKPISL